VRVSLILFLLVLYTEYIQMSSNREKLVQVNSAKVQSTHDRKPVADVFVDVSYCDHDLQEWVTLGLQGVI
jgi:hypothetical protein